MKPLEYLRFIINLLAIVIVAVIGLYLIWIQCEIIYEHILERIK